MRNVNFQDTKLHFLIFGWMRNCDFDHAKCHFFSFPFESTDFSFFQRFFAASIRCCCWTSYRHLKMKKAKLLYCGSEINSWVCFSTGFTDDFFNLIIGYISRIEIIFAGSMPNRIPHEFPENY